MTSQIEGWDKSKVTGLMRKTCVADLRAVGVSTAEVDFHSGWNGGTQDRNYARESLQADMNAQAKAAGFARDFRQHHYLGRADIAVPKAWYNALLPGLTSLLDTISSLPCEDGETLQCIALFVQAFWQALPIKTLKYGKGFQRKQLKGVQEVMDTEAYGAFATNVREAELDSMKQLGQVPYLETWAEEQVPLSYAVKGSAASEDKPASKRQRLDDAEVQVGVGSALAEKRMEYAAHAEEMECMRLEIQMSQERARLAKAKAEAEADAAIAADNRAVQTVQAQMIATAAAARDLPIMQQLDPSSTLPYSSLLKSVTLLFSRNASAFSLAVLLLERICCRRAERSMFSLQSKQEVKMYVHCCLSKTRVLKHRGHQRCSSLQPVLEVVQQ